MIFYIHTSHKYDDDERQDSRECGNGAAHLTDTATLQEESCLKTSSTPNTKGVLRFAHREPLIDGLEERNGRF